ncbi:hypothetical protein SanaruYs_16220 [Chryseotalea sanaruensis]|uniref:Uncharacterized protein n=1 Tax=Chryseotalea sanaruensis TaxID=2482724 RepID=A0A401U940_9BACT|nr:hypothetical protein [Chryseotalea sanaruensis]GCC51397.1 hypothetical protein SanaruYs_16220 [Chryseotalea sanaruensis]
MKKVKEGLRLLVMVIFLILAAFGMGIMGNILNNNRERYMDKEVRIERVDKKRDDDGGDEVKN